MTNKKNENQPGKKTKVYSNFSLNEKFTKSMTNFQGEPTSVPIATQPKPVKPSKPKAKEK